jgi:lipoprotein-anchoring transpeptidase ErfK/SrfK
MALSACVTEPGTLASSPAATKTMDEAYVARQDGTFTIPAIPLEQRPPQFRRQVVDFPSDEAPGTVIIHPGERHLYFITGNNKAIR